MKQEFWHNAWNSGKTGWQQKNVNTRLQRFWPAVMQQVADAATSEPGLPAPIRDTVFVPLCGSSTDMLWLLEQGLHVVGSELSEVAVESFFSHPDLQGQVSIEVTEASSAGAEFKVYRADNITICCGDYFSLDPVALDLPPLTTVYDRAALVALPPDMRLAYVQQLKQLLPKKARVLLIGFAYDQNKMDGPPFSVTDAEIQSLYDDGFSLRQLASSSGPEILGNLADRGLDTMTETVYLAERL